MAPTSPGNLLALSVGEAWRGLRAGTTLSPDPWQALWLPPQEGSPVGDSGTGTVGQVTGPLWWGGWRFTDSLGIGEGTGRDLASAPPGVTASVTAEAAGEAPWRALFRSLHHSKVLLFSFS